ncbi:hypothetical protein EMIT0P253_50006 [Pseudomonas sp. IT-P253]
MAREKAPRHIRLTGLRQLQNPFQNFIDNPGSYGDQHNVAPRAALIPLYQELYLQLTRA